MFKQLKILGVALTASVGLFVLPANSSAATLANYTATVSNAGQMTGNMIQMEVHTKFVYLTLGQVTRSEFNFLN